MWVAAGVVARMSKRRWPVKGWYRPLADPRKVRGAAVAFTNNRRRETVQCNAGSRCEQLRSEPVRLHRPPN